MDCLRTNVGRRQTSALGGEGHPKSHPAAPGFSHMGSRRSGASAPAQPRRVSSDRFPATPFLSEHPNPINSHGQQNASRAAPMPRSRCGPAPRTAPGTAGVGDATVVPQPEVPASVPLLTCQTPSSPRCRGWVINQCHMFSLSSH